MQLSRAKPGNPASIDIGLQVRVFDRTCDEIYKHAKLYTMGLFSCRESGGGGVKKTGAKKKSGVETPQTGPVPFCKSSNCMTAV